MAKCPHCGEDHDTVIGIINRMETSRAIVNVLCDANYCYWDMVDILATAAACITVNDIANPDPLETRIAKFVDFYTNTVKNNPIPGGKR